MGRLTVIDADGNTHVFRAGRPEVTAADGPDAIWKRF